MSINTTKTNLYVIDPDGDPTPTLLTVGEVTAVDGIDAPISSVDNTHLGSDHRTFIPGLAEPAQANFTINFDPADASQARMFQLRNDRKILHFCMGFSDGTDEPTLDGDDFDTTENGRTNVYWDAFLQSFPFSADVNDVVSAQVTMQLVNIPQLVAKEA